MFWPTILGLAAAYNFVIGGGGLARRGASREARLVGLLVAGFGIVYAVAATDPARFAPMLWAGVFGKIGVIALMAPAVARGELPRAIGWVLTGDAAFAILFVVLLLGIA